MTTTQIVTGVAILGAIGGVIYLSKKDDKKAEKTALTENAGEKIEVPETKVIEIPNTEEKKVIPAETTPAQVATIKRKCGTFAFNQFKPKPIEPMGGRPETQNIFKNPIKLEVKGGIASAGIRNSIVMSIGSKGIHVEELQERLGFVSRAMAAVTRYAFPGPNKVDGDFGQKTEDALFKSYGVKSIRLKDLKPKTPGVPRSKSSLKGWGKNN